MKDEVSVLASIGGVIATVAVVVALAFGMGPFSTPGIDADQRAKLDSVRAKMEAPCEKAPDGCWKEREDGHFGAWDGMLKGAYEFNRDRPGVSEWN